MPNEKKRKSREDSRREFNRNNKEERYASSYERFEPLPHTPCFVNRLTKEETLKSMIRTAASTSEFAIDTESVNIRGQGNIPALIQILMISDNRP